MESWHVVGRYALVVARWGKLKRVSWKVDMYGGSWFRVGVCLTRDKLELEIWHGGDGRQTRCGAHPMKEWDITCEKENADATRLEKK